MQSDEMLDDGQTETGASRIPRTRPFHPIEPFEDPREIGVGNAWTPIIHRKRQSII